MMVTMPGQLPNGHLPQQVPGLAMPGALAACHDQIEAIAAAEQGQLLSLFGGMQPIPNITQEQVNANHAAATTTTEGLGLAGTGTIFSPAIASPPAVDGAMGDSILGVGAAGAPEVEGHP